MAAAVFNQVIITYLDKNGGMANTFWAAQDQSEGAAASYAALALAAQGVSCAAVIGVQFQSTMQVTATPVDGPYCTVFDRATMLTRIELTGKPTRQQIIAPVAGIFLADNETVDLANPLVMALQSEAMAALGDKMGNAQGPYYRGLRGSAKTS